VTQGTLWPCRRKDLLFPRRSSWSGYWIELPERRASVGRGEPPHLRKLGHDVGDPVGRAQSMFMALSSPPTVVTSKIGPAGCSTRWKFLDRLSGGWEAKNKAAAWRRLAELGVVRGWAGL